jgi:RHS repeat-associated protein
MTRSYVLIRRLTSETRTGTNAFTASYTVDGVGNRTAQTVGGNSTSFTLNTDDELTATSGGFTNSYTYNANGEQTGRTLGGTATSLSYDYDGQLTQITQGQTSTDFAYDALGRRFSRTAGGATTEFVYGAGGMALEKQGGTYTQACSVGNGLLRRGSEYPLFDGHGSERTVTNSSQTVTGSVNFEAFGQVAGSSGSSASPYMYAGDWGYRTDGDAGLMHVGARYYDAQVGRFITRDTVLSEHPYLYCEHEPVGFVDPSGHVAGGVLYLAAAALAGVGVVAAVDYIEDGTLDRPWWHYGIGAGLGAVVGVAVGAITVPGGIAIGGMGIRMGLHWPRHDFGPLLGKQWHYQINIWRVGIKGTEWEARLPMVAEWWKYYRGGG